MDIITSRFSKCLSKKHKPNASQDAKIYYRYLAEKYVDKNVCGPYEANGKTYFGVWPVGYIEKPAGDKFEKQLVELPAKVRKLETDKYNVIVREKLIVQLQKFFIDSNIANI